MNKKVLVVDYDRTLYTNHNDMINNIKAIDEFRSKGNIFIIATGRTYTSLKNEIDKYGINYDYLILNHGALVIKKDNTPLFHYKLNRNDLLDVNDYLNELNPKDIFYSYYLEDTRDINNPDISKVTVTLKSNLNNFKNTIADVVKKYNKKFNIYFTQKYEIEIISKDTNKSQALNLLMKKANFNKENIYTIGDSYTDIEMIHDYNGACMENSIDILKNDKNIIKYKSVYEYINKIIGN